MGRLAGGGARASSPHRGAGQRKGLGKKKRKKNGGKRRLRCGAFLVKIRKSPKPKLLVAHSKGIRKKRGAKGSPSKRKKGGGGNDDAGSARTRSSREKRAGQIPSTKSCENKSRKRGEENEMRHPEKKGPDV